MSQCMWINVRDDSHSCPIWKPLSNYAISAAHLLSVCIRRKSLVVCTQSEGVCLLQCSWNQ